MERLRWRSGRDGHDAEASGGCQPHAEVIERASLDAAAGGTFAAGRRHPNRLATVGRRVCGNPKPILHPVIEGARGIYEH